MRLRPKEDPFLHVLEAELAHLRRFAATLAPASDVDDIVQETTIRAWKYRDSYKGTSSFRSWIFTICRRVAIDQSERRERHVHLQIPEDLAALPGEANELQSIVEALPADEQRAFVLTQLVGLKYDEAAEVEGVPIGTIRSRVARARQRMIAELASTEYVDLARSLGS